ncbi:alpha-tocopherol transfer protein-like [Microplitis mediator]|uniref:alpha-tocopherol transfer protein-like n=1 Tax=Microplitis mediator TaxID=375433 RepID=UPI002556D82E|nr:alpha-tocopherol transfer protein-like [Microplitis mediator]XP_057340371.1 alpha-tocopherol transfer protein-like [Microplitis mediator]
MALIQMVPLEEELKRNPELKKSDIEILKEWCEKQLHLPKISDSELVLFLHSNYYQIEPTKETIDAFYTMRTHVPEYFSNRDPLENKELRQSLQTVTFIPLAGETPEGYKIIYGRLINFEPSAYVWNDAIKSMNMTMDLWMYTEGTMKGHIILVELTGLAFGHSTRISPLGCKRFINYLQDGLPVRLKGIHFTKSIPVMQIILGMMKPFMKKELTDILHVHTTDETVEKFLPLDLLPNESGGKAGPLMELHKKQTKNLEDHRDFFLEEQVRARVDESRRPVKEKNGYFGLFKGTSS